MNQKNNIVDTLISLELQLNQYDVRSSHTKLSALLAADYLEYVASGKVLTKEDVLNRLPTVDDKSKIESHSFKAQYLSSDTVHLTYISKKINADGSSLQYLRSSLWKLLNNQWQLVFNQGTIKS